MSQAIDLRSDTVTQPGKAMRAAMADAPVGDDVYGEDPTVNLLQERIADLLGHEAALFVPSGSMADQIALKVLTRPGDAIMLAPDAHIAFHEAGATPALCGIQFTFMEGDGRFGPEQVKAHFHENDHHFPPTTLVEIENTYNMGGGLCWELDQLRAVILQAKELGMGVMMDGARLWNAAAATGKSEAEIAKGFDAVTVCMSKGLGAPVGSLLAGSKELIHRAHRVRKMLGGGMRQAGILAAAGLYALDHHRQRLGDDHDNARFLADGIASIDGVTLATEGVDTNILIVDVDESTGSAADLQARCADQGLLFWPTQAQQFRWVTHLDVSRADCERALQILSEVCAGQ